MHLVDDHVSGLLYSQIGHSFGILYRLQFMYDTAGALVLIVSGQLIPGFVCSALI